MPSGDTQQSERRTFRTPSVLLPVSERVNADPHGESELYLSESDKAPQSDDVLTRLKLSEHEPLPNSRGKSSGELFFGQLWNFSHRRSFM